MRLEKNDRFTEMGSKAFQDLIRNKKNLLSVFTLQGKLNQDTLSHPENFKHHTAWDWYDKGI